MKKRGTSKMKFIDKYLTGTASAEDIDNYVGDWHANYNTMPLHAFLGMTRKEYEIWILNPEALESILQRRLTDAA